MDFRPEWNEASDRYGIAGVLRNIAPLVALYAALPWLADQGQALPWLAVPVIGTLLYRLTIVLHDCLHGTLFRRRIVNRAVGEFLGALTGIDFLEFRRRHLEHHRIFGKPDDPQGFHYLGLSGMSRTVALCHVLRPLLGGNLRHVFAESVLHPGNLVRMVRDGRIVGVVLVQAAVLVMVTGFGAHPSLALIPPVSAATVGLFLSQIRGIAEHGVRGDVGQEGFVRSHAAKWVDRLLLYDLNFNFHQEHHRHPGVPSCHLPAVHKATGLPVAGAGMCTSVAALVK